MKNRSKSENQELIETLKQEELEEYAFNQTRKYIKHQKQLRNIQNNKIKSRFSSDEY